MSASTHAATTKGDADAAESDARLFSPGQLARRLGIGEGKVRRWIELGQLRAVDLAGQPGPQKRRRLRISEADLRAFEDSRSNVPSSPPFPVGRTRAAKTKTGDVTEFIEG